MAELAAQRACDRPLRPRVVAGLRLVDLVGLGGEGEVWEARDRSGRRRALKLVRPDALADDARARVAHLVRIDHPALVRVHGGGVLADGLLAGWGWLEMDFVEGQPLHAAAGDPHVLGRLRPLAEALDALHEGAWSDGLPLVHRDVKPANLVAPSDGGVVLVDPSTLRGLDTTQLTRVGTPVFCAPEVMSGRIGPAADVYSFAVTVVALVTGARGQALVDLLDDVDALGLPPGVRRALSERPGDRPSSCVAVLDATMRFADDLPDPNRIPHRGDSVPGGTAYPVWGIAFLGAAVAGLVTAVVAGALPPLWLAVAAALHLVGTRRRIGLALLLPPLAWAFVLADAGGCGERRAAWLRASLAGALGALTAGLVGEPALVAAGAGSAGAALIGYAGRGWAGRLARVVALPAWLLGAVLLLAGGLAVLPVALLSGRLRPLGRLLGWTVAGVVEVGRRT